MSKPPYAKIDPPIEYVEWEKNKQFFGQKLSWTHTEVINDAKLDGTRYAYGVSQGGFWFSIRLTKPEHESGFWNEYLKWRATPDAGTMNSFASADMVKPPPTCGTPSTPPCPPPDDLDEAIRSLAKDLAGVGASTDAVKTAIARVRKMLIDTTSAVQKMLKS